MASNVFLDIKDTASLPHLVPFVPASLPPSLPSSLTHSLTSDPTFLIIAVFIHPTINPIFTNPSLPSPSSPHGHEQPPPPHPVDMCQKAWDIPLVQKTYDTLQEGA